MPAQAGIQLRRKNWIPACAGMTMQRDHLMRLVFLLSALLLLGASKIPGIAPGSLAPEAAGIVLQGPEGIKLSQLRGKVVVLDFWATWCGPCQQSLPLLSALNEEMRKLGYGERFAMLGVSIDQDTELARRYLKAHPLSYPVVNDMLGVSTQTYGLWRFPATFLIKPDGHIHYIYWGYGDTSTADLRQRVIGLLKETAASR